MYQQEELEHYNRIITEARKRFGACVDSAAEDCDVGAISHNGPPSPITLCNLLFPRARAHMLRLDLTTLPGMAEFPGESVDSYEDTETAHAEAMAALAHSEVMSRIVGLRFGGIDFGEDTYAEVFGGEEATEGRPVHRWAIGSDGRGWVGIVEDATDGGCFSVRLYRTVFADVPSYLDEVTRRPAHVTRRGRLMRYIDVSGVSGPGHVADVELLRDGRVAVAWRGETPSVAVHTSAQNMERVHFHDGKSRVEWTTE